MPWLHGTSTWFRSTTQRLPRGDWDAAGRCVGPGYAWIDHGTGVVARTPKELYEAQVDADAWSDTRIEITDAYELQDGTVIVQVSQSCIVTGSWRGMETTGQRISFRPARSSASTRMA